MIKSLVYSCCVSFGSGVLAAGSVSALTLKKAVDEALKSGPELLLSAWNGKAAEFGLRQTRGLYLPTPDMVIPAGGRKLDSRGPRRLATETFLRPG